MAVAAQDHGQWIGYVEVMRWDETRRSCESIQIIHQECNSEQESVEAARRLLSENVHLFTAGPAWMTG
jgi:hypothetical protein